jgi:hypothetical protein
MLTNNCLIFGQPILGRGIVKCDAQRLRLSEELVFEKRPARNRSRIELQ